MMRVNMKDRRKYYRKYNNSKQGKLRNKSYQQTEKYREAHRKAQIKFHQKHKEYYKLYNEKYFQTEKGREKRRKSLKKHYQNNKEIYAMKRDKRNRNLGFNVIAINPYINTNIEFDWHHINNNDVIAVPRNVHKSMLGNQHREHVNEWIEIHYDINLKNENKGE